MGVFQLEVFYDSVICGIGFSVFSAPLRRKDTPPLPTMLSQCVHNGNSCQTAFHCKLRTIIPWWHSTFFIFHIQQCSLSIIHFTAFLHLPHSNNFIHKFPSQLQRIAAKAKPTHICRFQKDTNMKLAALDKFNTF